MSLALRGERLLLAPVRAAPWRPLFEATVLGYAANNLLPVRLGEVVRAFSGAHLTGGPWAGWPPAWWWSAC